MKIVVMAVSLVAFAGAAQAFSVAPPNKAMQAQIKQKLERAAKSAPVYKDKAFGRAGITVTQGFGKTPPGFIGTGLWGATVTVQRGGMVDRRQYSVVGTKPVADGGWTRVPFLGPVVRQP